VAAFEHIGATALLTLLEHGRGDLGEIVENFDRLPEAHSPDGDLWTSYDELRAAC